VLPWFAVITPAMCVKRRRVRSRCRGRIRKRIRTTRHWESDGGSAALFAHEPSFTGRSTAHVV